MINAIFYPIFIRSNGTSEMSGQDFACFLLALFVLGIFMLIGSLIYSMVRAITSTYWGFNWHDIKTIWSDTFCYIVGWICVISPIIFMLFVFLICYIKQILF
jgi:hypothetical protein